MITREQLELAALAYGIDPSWSGNAAFMDGWLSRWRPHTDPGDAARLAVRLNMEINMSHGQVAATVGCLWHWEGESHDGTEPDKLRAWCGAVTLCAAAVGERMKGGA